MNLYVPVAYLKKFKEAGADGSVIYEAIRWKGNEDSVSIDSDDLTEDQLDQLATMAEAGHKKNEKGALSLVQKLTTLSKLTSDPSGVKIGRLESLATAGKAYIAKHAEHRWLFTTTEEGHLIPYYVEEIEYHPPERESPASTAFSLSAISRNERDDDKIHFSSDELKHRTVSELLKDKGYFIETKELVAAYEKQMEKYKALVPQMGEQFLATGTAKTDEHWGWGTIAMEREGMASKVVLDDTINEDGNEEKKVSSIIHDTFWNKKSDDDEDGVPVAIPLHPYVKVFDLDHHEFLIIHTDNLSPYVYDSTLIHKLVLAEEKKSLVHMLVAGSSENMSDIVKGKMSGVIVIATGAPGTGKTLTAEVFSEEIKRPLYVVQCSQLGTNEETLEKELTKVLARASRWKAILLIDEADVYIHERGDDIQQNAIVGVFLRVLEYYRGVLFMTSNRATIT